MPPTVSVVIPAYNRVETIARAVVSVRAQTFQDFEIVIVDDGSIDQTRDIVRQLDDERIRLISHEKNLGAAAARNTGMKSAVGKYIAWLDSDDEWFPKKLEQQLAAFKQAAQDQRASYTAYELVEKQGARIHIPKPVDYKKLFLGCDLSPGATLMFERTLLDEIGYIDTTLPRYEDWDWLLLYASKYRFLAVEHCLARIHYSAQRSAKAVEISSEAFLSKHSHALKKFGSYRNVVISRRWMEVASYYAREHQVSKMVQYIFKALFIQPLQPLDVWAWLINSWLNIKLRDLFYKG